MAAVTQAETQLANTSLNGIDLFNTITDETTIPTVVESLNAQIEESCHSTNKPTRISSSVPDGSATLQIKHEEECKSNSFFIKHSYDLYDFINIFSGDRKQFRSMSRLRQSTNAIFVFEQE